MTRPPPKPPLFPHTALFRSGDRRKHADRAQVVAVHDQGHGFVIALQCRNVEERQIVLGRGHRQARVLAELLEIDEHPVIDRKSTRLNSSHSQITYAVFCWKKINLCWRNAGNSRSSRASSRVIYTRSGSAVVGSDRPPPANRSASRRPSRLRVSEICSRLL